MKYRTLLPLAALGIAMALACSAVWTVTREHGIENLRRGAAARLERNIGTLKSTLDRYEYLPYLLSLHPYVQDALVSPNAASIDRANRYLTDLNDHARATVTYIVRADGRCIAASNWNTSGSFIGQDYRFRPYFVDAHNGGVGRFFGIGTISREPGYYISQPVYRDKQLVGVAVVKLNLEWFQHADESEPMMVADDHGVIFLSSNPAWKYRTLSAVAPSTLNAIRDVRQYAQEPLAPLAINVTDRLADNAQVVHVGERPLARAYLATHRYLADPAWQFVSMAPMTNVERDAANASVVTAFGLISLALLLFYMRMRRARAVETALSRARLQHAYAQLNRRVEERTADLSAANERLTSEVAERTRAEHELRAAQAELIQASKLAALGQMAAGITHELNQPLTALRSFSDNTRVLLERGRYDAAADNLAAIASLTERMGRITNQLKLFVGKARPMMSDASLSAVLRNVLVVLKPRLDGIALDSPQVPDAGAAGPDSPLRVHGEGLRLEQVLINILGNALDALKGRPSPHIAIDVQADSAHVTLTIDDNGPGMPEDVLPHVFEPFYTTKDIGDGLGLGLAISSSILRDCGGTLSASNRPEGGARFVVVLRRSDGAQGIES
ncbi:two-component system, NtrC family, C4-dicarboxylate transport sensor histidine kinase DctB [Pararobbsia alpina]|uniref:sensor histidine kinase n=1 Tax=Pararobbsia alpina TaxID=621374 RepID=UPI0039A6FFD7